MTNSAKTEKEKKERKKKDKKKIENKTYSRWKLLKTPWNNPNTLHSFLKRFSKHGFACGDGRKLDKVTIIDEARSGRGWVVFETPRPIMHERRGLVFQTDFAENFHGDLKVTRRESKLLKCRDSIASIPNPVRNIWIRQFLWQVMQYRTLRVDFVFVRSILDRFRWNKV